MRVWVAQSVALCRTCGFCPFARKNYKIGSPRYQLASCYAVPDFEIIERPQRIDKAKFGTMSPLVQEFSVGGDKPKPNPLKVTIVSHKTESLALT